MIILSIPILTKCNGIVYTNANNTIPLLNATKSHGTYFQFACLTTELADVHVVFAKQLLASRNVYVNTTYTNSSVAIHMLCMAANCIEL